MAIIIVLVVLQLLPSNGLCNLVEDGNPFLLLSLLQTYLTIILSVIGSINLRKGGQLDLKAKILLGLSVSCQMVARLLVMVTITLAAIFQEQVVIRISMIIKIGIVDIVVIIVGRSSICGYSFSNIINADRTIALVKYHCAKYCEANFFQ